MIVFQSLACRLIPAWFLAVTSAGVLSAQTAPAIDIVTASESPLERAGRNQLLRLLAEHDLKPWTFTRTVRIQPRVIPHSHPVLTLNTRYLDNDTAQVATYVHEQVHWFLAERQAATDSAIAELMHLYPEVPSGPPDGARDTRSTYLHLLVCTLELDGVSRLFGEAAAQRTLAGWRHYVWIYREVLARPARFREILRTYGLDLDGS